METEISTPVETTDTSFEFEPESTDTSNLEPDLMTAEKLFAGKYKTVEELEKGYLEAQKSVSKASEYEKKYNELVHENNRQIQTQSEQSHRTQLLQQVKNVEMQVFKDNLHLSQNPQAVMNLLDKFEETKDEKYLQEAKKQFSTQFLEDATIAKMRFQNVLEENLKTKLSEENTQRLQNLTKVIAKKFPQFLSDIKTNPIKKETLGTLLNSGVINSIEDMKVFENIYSKVIKHERDMAIREYEATNAINSAKSKSVIDAGITNFSMVETPPTYSQLAKMSQSEFNDACEKFGLAAILSAE